MPPTRILTCSCLLGFCLLWSACSKGLRKHQSRVPDAKAPSLHLAFSKLETEKCITSGFYAGSIHGHVRLSQVHRRYRLQIQWSSYSVYTPLGGRKGPPTLFTYGRVRWTARGIPPIHQASWRARFEQPQCWGLRTYSPRDNGMKKRPCDKHISSGWLSCSRSLFRHIRSVKKSLFPSRKATTLIRRQGYVCQAPFLKLFPPITAFALALPRASGSKGPLKIPLFDTQAMKLSSGETHTRALYLLQ